MDSLIDQIREDTCCALGQYFLAEKLLRARQHTRAQALTENMLQQNSGCSLAHVQMVKARDANFFVSFAIFGICDWESSQSIFFSPANFFSYSAIFFAICDLRLVCKSRFCRNLRFAICDFSYSTICDFSQMRKLRANRKLRDNRKSQITKS